MALLRSGSSVRQIRPPMFTSDAKYAGKGGISYAINQFISGGNNSILVKGSQVTHASDTFMYLEAGSAGCTAVSYNSFNRSSIHGYRI